MKVQKNHKIRYTQNGVEKEGIVAGVFLDGCYEEIHVKGIFEKTILYDDNNVSVIVREKPMKSLMLHHTYEKKGEEFVRVYYNNGKRSEVKAPLRLFIKIYFDNVRESICCEVNGAKNPFPFRKAYGINVNMLEDWLKEQGWTRIKTVHHFI